MEVTVKEAAKIIHVTERKSWIDRFAYLVWQPVLCRPMLGALTRERVAEMKTRSGRKRLGEKEMNWQWSYFYFCRLEDTHSQRQFINCLSALSPPSSLFRGNLVRVRCRDNLTWTQNIHSCSTKLTTKKTTELFSRHSQFKLRGSVGDNLHNFITSIIPHTNGLQVPVSSQSLGTNHWWIHLPSSVYISLYSPCQFFFSYSLSAPRHAAVFLTGESHRAPPSARWATWQKNSRGDHFILPLIAR